MGRWAVARIRYAKIPQREIFAAVPPSLVSLALDTMPARSAMPLIPGTDPTAP